MNKNQVNKQKQEVYAALVGKLTSIEIKVELLDATFAFPHEYPKLSWLVAYKDFKLASIVKQLIQEKFNMPLRSMTLSHVDEFYDDLDQEDVRNRLMVREENPTVVYIEHDEKKTAKELFHMVKNLNLQPYFKDVLLSSDSQNYENISFKDKITRVLPPINLKTLINAELHSAFDIQEISNFPQRRVVSKTRAFQVLLYAPFGSGKNGFKKFYKYVPFSDTRSFDEWTIRHPIIITDKEYLIGTAIYNIVCIPSLRAFRYRCGLKAVGSDQRTDFDQWYHDIISSSINADCIFVSDELLLENKALRIKMKEVASWIRSAPNPLLQCSSLYSPITVELNDRCPSNPLLKRKGK